MSLKIQEIKNKQELVAFLKDFILPYGVFNRLEKLDYYNNFANEPSVGFYLNFTLKEKDFSIFEQFIKEKIYCFYSPNIKYNENTQDYTFSSKYFVFSKDNAFLTIEFLNDKIDENPKNPIYFSLEYLIEHSFSKIDINLPEIKKIIKYHTDNFNSQETIEPIYEKILLQQQVSYQQKNINTTNTVFKL